VPENPGKSAALGEGAATKPQGRVSSPVDWAWLGRIVCAAGVGLLLCSIANALSRGTESTSTVLYWLGILLIAFPIFYRLTSREASAPERLLLVCLLGLGLYGVKVARDSLLFTFPDEFVHGYNADQIVNHHHLFEPAPAIPITPHYPGLEGATSALMMLGGVSSYTAGTIVVGVARLVMMIGLFLLFGRISGSARTAGLATAIYTGTANFVYFDAQFSYESLALPLLVAILAAFAERESEARAQRALWVVVIAILMAALIPTHHLSSYALVLVFAALALIYWVLGVRRPNPWPFALAALILSVGWLLIVANSTIDYLRPVLEEAFRGTFETASGDREARTLFHATGAAGTSGGVTPIPARGIALLAVLLLGVGFLFGLREVWRRYRTEPFPLLFVIAGLGFFITLTLRFAPAAWETGNRAGEFLFIGLAFVVALGVLELLKRRPKRLGERQGAVILAGCLAVVLCGGVISGWPWDGHLARPIRAPAQGNEVVSESLALSRWASRHLQGERVAGPEADVRVMLSPGDVKAYGGKNPDIVDIVQSPELEDWQLPLLRINDYRYVVADRRLASSDPLRGIYFSVPGQGDTTLSWPEVLHKFAEIPVGRLYNSGRIAVYDMENKP